MKKAAMALALALAGVVLVSGRAGAEEEEGWRYVRIKLNYWTASYNGEVKLEDTSPLNINLGESLDLEDDLGLENPEGIPEGEVVVRLSRNHRIILSYFTVTYRGDERLTSDIDVGGSTFVAGTDFESEFAFSRLKVLHSWTPLNNETGNLALMWGLENYWWNVSYDGTDLATGMKTSEDESLSLPIPVIGIGGELNLPWGFGLYGSITGSWFSNSDLEASYTDIDAGVSWQYKFVYAAVGYRTIDTMLADENAEPEVDFRFKHDGLVATVGVQL